MYFSKILQRISLRKCTQASSTIRRTIISSKMYDKPTEEKQNFTRKIFSGIQPTGQLHLGNYLGAVQKWTQLQNERENVSYCIVDMHSLTMPQNPAVLRENTFEMAATMFACGLNPEQSTIFVQSSVQEHAELCWILSCLCTMPRLGHLPQFKEKSRTTKDIPLGLYVYPVLQAADILLYKATHVPVGEDQLQHIQLAQHLARTFNSKYGTTFPICHAMIENNVTARIRSLRNPSKKMSKSDVDSKATININDNPELIVEKVKKAVTDFTSDVTYDPVSRPGVSNLVIIHSLVSNTPIEQILEEAKTTDTGRYKARVAEAIVEHLKPIRYKIEEHLSNKNDLIFMLEMGAEKAKVVARQNIEEIKQKMGLGTNAVIPRSIDISAEIIETPVKETKQEPSPPVQKESDGPKVPKQKIRQEHRRIGKAQYRPMQSTFKLDDDETLVPLRTKAQ